MRVLILTIGTRGDVQPHIALAVGLSRAGHRVTVCTSPRYRDLFEGQGPDFAPLNDDIVALVESAEGRVAIEDMASFVAGVRAAVRLLRDHGDIQRALVRDGWAAAEATRPDVIVYHPKMAAGLHYAERLGIPAVIAPLYPLFLPTTAFPNLGLAPLPFDGAIARGYNRVSHWLVRAVVRAVSVRYVRDWRSAQGLPPIPRGCGVVRRADGTRVPFLNAWSEHVAPNPPDWPADIATTGYWFLDRPGDWQPSAALTAFLDEGPPPVYIGFGSMAARDPEQTTQTVLRTLRQTGQRALLARGWGGIDANDTPDAVFLLDEAPHDWLFPQCAAVVHHGGAGTTAAGLRAGRPTVICPFFGDQPFWGRRVHALGAGPPPIPQKKLTADRLSMALRSATGDTTMRRRAAQIGEKIRAEDGIGRAIDCLQHIAEGKATSARHSDRIPCNNSTNECE